MKNVNMLMNSLVTVRVLTYNTWHGLSGKGLFKFPLLEPLGRMERRRARQIQLLDDSKSDLIFLQELNPVAELAQSYARSLRREVVWQGDNAGLKWRGWGLPHNLDSGIATLFNPEWKLLESRGLWLSGDRVDVGDFTWQVKESRFALFARFELPDGRTLTCINCHLHHGPELIPELEAQCLRWLEERKIREPAYFELMKRLREPRERRFREIERLLSALARDSSDVVFVAGDLNASPDSRELALFKHSGFSDSWVTSEPGYTWDSSRNAANHATMSDFHLPIEIKDLNLGTEIQETFRRFLLEFEKKPRRIDYLLHRGAGVAVKEVKLFGDQMLIEKKYLPSDHFGVQAELIS